MWLYVVWSRCVMGVCKQVPRRKGGEGSTRRRRPPHRPKTHAPTNTTKRTDLDVAVDDLAAVEVAEGLGELPDVGGGDGLVEAGLGGFLEHLVELPAGRPLQDQVA